MGEIKSTLDLVMEKTRHLTLSQEEKRFKNGLKSTKGFKVCFKNIKTTS